MDGWKEGRRIPLPFHYWVLEGNFSGAIFVQLREGSGFWLIFVRLFGKHRAPGRG